MFLVTGDGRDVDKVAPLGRGHFYKLDLKRFRKYIR